MRLQRTGHAIGASLTGFTLLLTSPDIGTAQEAAHSELSVDRPLRNAMSSISWFSWNGIWVRSNGGWAWRPTVRTDWQAYFRCQSGNGCGGVGWAGRSPWNWWPGGYASWGPTKYGRWDFDLRGWMWFPGDASATAWDLWPFGPRYGVGARGFSPHSRGMPLAGIDQGFMPTRGFEQRDPHAVPSSARGPDPKEILVNPVRIGPVVTLSPDGTDSRPSGRTVSTSPSIERVRIGPLVEFRANQLRQRIERQKLEGNSGNPQGRERYLPGSADLDRFKAGATQPGTKSRPGSLSNPSVNRRRGNAVGTPRASSAAGRLKSPRSPATGTRTTGPSKSKNRTAREQ